MTTFLPGKGPTASTSQRSPAAHWYDPNGFNIGAAATAPAAASNIASEARKTEENVVIKGGRYSQHLQYWL